MRFGVATLWIALSIASCGRKADIFGIRQIRHVAEAPPSTAKAIGATVMVEAAIAGTGFFVNDSGLLVTNNHVLGAETTKRSRCAAEGCWISIVFDYERGKKHTRRELFVTPIRASQSLDVSVFQVWENKVENKKLSTPTFLPLEVGSAPELYQQVHVIGHAATGLKKWSVGSVFETGGPFFRMDNFTLKGNSGGAIVGPTGNLVGIFHHLSDSHDHLAASEIRAWSQGTAFPFVRAMVTNTPEVKAVSAFPSVKTERTEAAVVDMGDVYLLAHEKNVNLEGGNKAEILEILGRQCDRSLKKDIPVSDDFDDVHRACYDALKWVDCKSKGEDRPNYKSCPVDPEKAGWQERFDKLAERASDAGLLNPYQTVISPMFFEREAKDREKVEQERLDAFLKKHKPSLTPTVAFYLIDAASEGQLDKVSYEGKNLRDYILEYRKIPAYGQHFYHLIQSVMMLYRNKVIDKAKTLQVTQAMLEDRAIPIVDRISLEEELYLEDLL